MEEPRDERDSLEPAPVTRQWSIPPTQEQIDDFDDILQHLRKSRSQPRNVSFSTIGIREYPLCLGDNPGCQNGVPISIDWNHVKETSMSVDEFEGLVKTRKDREVTKIPPMERFKMLRGTSLYSTNDIMKQLKRVTRDRDRREETVQSLKSQYLHEKAESLRRAISNITLRRKEKRKERELLKPYKSKRWSSRASTTSTSALSLDCSAAGMDILDVISNASEASNASMVLTTGQVVEAI